MKEIQLTKGYVALVDDADYERLALFKWHARVNKARTLIYAQRTVRYGPRQLDRHRVIHMHHEVLGVSCGVDHRDNNGLNNQRYNLRSATQSQNMANSRRRLGTSSRFRGVCWFKKNRKWLAAVRKDGIKHYLGSFVDEMDAARAYDVKARELHGEFAKLNVPQEEAA